MKFGIYSFYSALQPRFRRNRRRFFLERFQPTDATTILDVGGNVYDWSDLLVSPQITILNVAATDPSSEYPAHFTYRQGDGRALPFPAQSFDIVYCNSVIEHLTHFSDQQRLAAECLRVGRRVFVQTPNRWFPVEPHFLSLFLHYLPKRAQRPLYRHLSLRGLLRANDDVDLTTLFDELRLLSAREMRALFPGCEIHKERLLGLTKSLIATRT